MRIGHDPAPQGGTQGALDKALDSGHLEVAKVGRAALVGVDDQIATEDRPEVFHLLFDKALVGNSAFQWAKSYFLPPANIAAPIDEKHSR